MFKILLAKRNPGEGLIEKHLLSFPNLNVFNYVFKLDALFPPMVRANLQVLTNRFFPVNCAADDFELNYSNDQVELYDFFSNPNVNHNHHCEAPNEHNHSSFPVVNLPYVKQEENPAEFGFDLGFDIPNEFNFKFQEPSGPVDQSHYNLNMIGINQTTYFNDFRPNMNTSAESTYSSSVESYISPLDDEFFKKTAPKKEFSSDLDDVDLFEVNSRDNSLTGSMSFVSGTLSDIPTPAGSMGLAPGLMAAGAPAVSKKRKSMTKQSPSVKRMKDDSFKHLCEYCHASFKVKGYLTRHIKKHNKAKAFKCPFYHDSTGLAGSANKGSKCHPSGGFSRRDTYKTHLKALHFIYPPGTKSSDRHKTSGRCGGCFKFFDNNVKWLEGHIEAGNCTAARMDVVKIESDEAGEL